MGFFSAFKEGFNEAKNGTTTNYAGGHPTIDNPQKVFIKLDNNEIEILSDYLKAKRNKLGSIQPHSIKNIVVEDKSTVSNRVTLGRVLLVGVFALFWKKKKKENDYYVIIEWNDGKFDHETAFEFEGNNAMALANTFRNKLIAFSSQIQMSKK